MPKKKIYNITKQQLENMKLLSTNNKVLIKVHDPNLNRITKSGIIMVSPTDMDWNPDVHADRYGIIQAVPKDINTSKMLWNTKMQVKVGDLVWYDYLMSLNSDSFFIDQTEYKLMDYQYLYVVKRGEDIICLNGYCLFEPVKDVLESKAGIIIQNDKYDVRQAKMIYSGAINRSYENEFIDDDTVKVGDVCIFSMPPIMLEADYYKFFEGKQRYRLSQRRFLFGYIRDNELFPVRDSLIVIPDERQKITDSGIEIPGPFRKRQNYGTVYKCGDNVIPEGSRVHYSHTIATYIEHEGVEYGFLKQSNVYYYS